MRARLRVVETAAGDFAVQAKWRRWFDAWWTTVDGGYSFSSVESARHYMASFATALLSREIKSVIEERAL